MTNDDFGHLVGAAAEDRPPAPVTLPAVSVLGAPPGVAANDNTPPAEETHGPAASGRYPLWEEYRAGRFDDGQLETVRWIWQAADERHEPESIVSGTWAGAGGGVPFVSRNPEALAGPEHHYDAAARWARLQRLSGALYLPLIRVVLYRAEIREAAPEGVPATLRAKAGRLRVCAGLDVAGLVMRAENDNRPMPTRLDAVRAIAPYADAYAELTSRAS